jgi:hypothetical protein
MSVGKTRSGIQTASRRKSARAPLAASQRSRASGIGMEERTRREVDVMRRRSGPGPVRREAVERARRV